MISVIIPVYNVEKYLDKCIESVVNQTYKNLEIILVDDGSTDTSGSICDEWKLKDDRIVVIHKENGGVSSARNVGLDKSKGEYIGFVDSDDYINPNMYEKLYYNMINKNADISMCNYFIHCKNKVDYHKCDNNNITIINVKENFYKMLNQDYFKGFSWNKLFKKSNIGKIRFSNDIHFAEDLLFVAEVAENCNSFCFDHECLYNYVIRKNSAINNTPSKKNITAINAYKKILTIVNKYCDSTTMSEYKITYFFWLNDICEKCKNLGEFNFKYIEERKSLYNEIINNKAVSFKKKAEIFVRYRLYFLFEILRNLKRKFSNKELS